MKQELTLEQVKERIHGLDEESQKAMVCALVGHSRIQTYCFGYYYCARCNAQVGDSLGSTYPEADLAVVVGHNCGICRANYEKCTWKDTFLTLDPFAEVTS